MIEEWGRSRGSEVLEPSMKQRVEEERNRAHDVVRIRLIFSLARLLLTVYSLFISSSQLTRWDELTRNSVCLRREPDLERTLFFPPLQEFRLTFLLLPLLSDRAGSSPSSTNCRWPCSRFEDSPQQSLDHRAGPDRRRVHLRTLGDQRRRRNRSNKVVVRELVYSSLLLRRVDVRGKFLPATGLLRDFKI